MKSRFDSVIFDFDGTIADTADGVFASIRYASQKLNKPYPDDETLRKFIGPPLLFSFREYLGYCDEDAEKAVELYREYYSDEGLFRLRFYDGILELAKLLRDKKVKVGIASAKPDVFIQRILEHFDIKGLFDYAKGISLEDYCTDKSYLFEKVCRNLGANDKKKVLVIGDKCFDVDGANEIGAVSAGVLFGYGTKEELENSHATFIAEKTSDLMKLIFEEE
ncbi:MAG: HAD hydrolase-like protein [Clostridia bacterium]|nr:HAD hydrolase-like protein [Clostridia bacterium]